ncbi:transposable element Tcb2 transposase [Trichonephila clavipes]|nr:transposable element Tcb2 transposase [Trichonephila clavipes]
MRVEPLSFRPVLVFLASSKDFEKRVMERPDHRDEHCRLVDAPCCWPGGSFGVCRLKLLGAVDTRGTHAWKTGSGATRKSTRREDRRILLQAFVDPTVTRSTIRANVGVAIVPQTISRHLAEANLKLKRPYRALPLTPEHRNSVYSGAKPDQCGMSQIGKRLCLVMNPDSSWPARSPDLSPVEHVWDQLKWQMPSCHSVHVLELAVQDLWAHLPQNNIWCLINSMPDRVAACIAAGGGPTRY